MAKGLPPTAMMSFWRRSSRCAAEKASRPRRRSSPTNRAARPTPHRRVRRRPSSGRYGRRRRQSCARGSASRPRGRSSRTNPEARLTDREIRRRSPVVGVGWAAARATSASRSRCRPAARRTRAWPSHPRAPPSTAAHRHGGCDSGNDHRGDGSCARPRRTKRTIWACITANQLRSAGQPADTRLPGTREAIPIATAPLHGCSCGISQKASPTAHC